MNIDNKGIQILLKDLDYQKLAVALKMASADLKSRFLKNMSQGMRDTLNDEISFLGSVRVSKVQKAQEEIIKKCQELEENQKIFIPKSSEEDRFI